MRYGILLVAIVALTVVAAPSLAASEKNGAACVSSDAGVAAACARILDAGGTTHGGRVIALNTRGAGEAGRDCPQHLAECHAARLERAALASPPKTAVDRSAQSLALAAGQPTAATVPAPEGLAVAASQTEIVFWNSIKDSSNPADFEAYLAQFPDGVFAALARNRLTTIKASPPSATEQSAPTAKTGQSSGAAGDPPPERQDWSCVALSVSAAHHDPNNGPWDTAFQGNPAPDIVVYERSSGFKSAECKDSYTCSVRFTPRGNRLNLRIVDVDTLKADEQIGAGTCALAAGVCKLGLARITIRHCP